MSKLSNNKPLLSHLRKPKMLYHLKGCICSPDDQAQDSSRTFRIWLDDIELLPEMGHMLRPFYSCEFDWGKNMAGGSFTAALTICLSLFKEERVAENLFTCFAEDIIHQLPHRDFDRMIDMNEFLRAYEERLAPDIYSCFCVASLINNREVLLHRDAETGLITADLSENYAIHHMRIPDRTLLRLSERRRKLLLSLFVKDTCVVKGNDFVEVMLNVEEILSRFYFRSLSRLIKKT